jgi:multiple sugar transport system substrate-binding protein
MSSRRRSAALAITAAAAIVVAACGGGGDGDAGDDETLLVWTTEDQGDRVQTQQRILDAWAQESGIDVELVPTGETQLTTVLTSAAATNELPDLLAAVSLNTAYQLQRDERLDNNAAAAVVESLGESTFSESALTLARDGDTQLAVPSDGWAQLLFYRTDLFRAAGLPPPETYEAMQAAAQTLNGGDVSGIVAATEPADAFTQQTFEHMALANDCQLTNDDGDVTLDSKECVEAADFYGNLIRNYGAAGNQNADTTRASYFAGRAAMVIWSTFMLDELAGLRNDVLPTCPECAASLTFLVENTGVVQALRGPSGDEPAAFGEVVSWAILQDAAPETAELVEYLMSDGYEAWLGIAPEGKIPVRHGTKSDPEAYVTAWKELAAGVDTKAPLSQFYDAATLESIVTAPDSFDRWGIPQGQGVLAGEVAGQYVVPAAIAGIIGGTSAAEAMRTAALEANMIKNELGS